MPTTADFNEDPEIQARLLQFNRAHGQVGLDAEQKLFAQANKAATATKRLIWLQRAADVLNTSMERAGVAACKAGCSHCCNIAVSISETEAQMLSKASGRKHAKNPQRSVIASKESFEGDAWLDKRDENVDIHYGVPCPFLSEGKCSQYANRPIACRQQFSMAKDDTPCIIGNRGEIVPYLNLGTRQLASVLSLGLGRTYADIRDWFPD